MLELAILGLLKEQPLHGYELKKRLADTLGLFWGVSFGSLYPALRRLERSGAIEAVTGDAVQSVPIPATGSIGGETAAARLRQRITAKTGRRTKKSYRITPTGDEVFTELMTTPDGADDERSFALKLAFCDHLGAEARLAFLERRRTELLEHLNRTRTSSVRGNRYTRSLVEHRNRTTERDLEWVDELITTEREESAPQQQGVPA